MTARLLMILSLVFALIINSLAQNDTILLDCVEITSSHVYDKTLQEKTMERKIDTSLIERMKTVSLSQLLIQHSPVFIKTYGPGGTASASFRGTTASHTLVLWNGFQLNSPTLGEVDFSTIPVFFTDEISLQWGSKTSANSGGLGGVVNVSNNQKFNEGIILDMKQTYGSFNTIGSYLTLGYSAKNIITRIKAYRNSSDNDFVYKNIATIPHQEMKQKNADFVDYGMMPEMQIRFKSSLLTIVSWNQWSHRNYPQIMPNVLNNADEYADNDFSRNFLSYKIYWSSGRIEMKSAYFFERQSYFLETYTSNGSPVTQTNTLNKSNIFRQIIDLQQDIYKLWKFYAKFQYDYENVSSSNFDADTDMGMKNRNIISFYAAIDGKIYRDLDLRMTLRNDIVDSKSAGFFPTATLTYKIPFLKGLTFNAGYSHNYRNPTLNDLYWNPGGNPNLEAENGRTFDLDVIYLYEDVKFNLELRGGFYCSKVRNWIQWVPTNYRYWTPMNVSEVMAHGFETHLRMNYKHRLWNFSLSGNYVYSRTTDESEYAQQYEVDGKQLIYIPLHHANVFADVKWRTWNLNYTLEFTGERKTSMNDDEFFAYKLPYYILHHVSIGKRLNRFRIEFKINNLTDKDYQTVLWRAMPGRSCEIYCEFKL